MRRQATYLTSKTVRNKTARKMAVHATYKLAKKPATAFAEAQQQINGIIAEVRAGDARHFGMRAAGELRAAA
jgi:hypothetical protein